MATAIERDGLATTNGSISGVVKEGLYSSALPEYIAMQALVADWRKEQETTGSFFVAIGTSPAVILLAPYTTSHKLRVVEPEQAEEALLASRKLATDIKNGSEFDKERNLVAALRRTSTIPDHY